MKRNEVRQRESGGGGVGTGGGRGAKKVSGRIGEAEGVGGVIKYLSHCRLNRIEKAVGEADLI